MQVTHIGTIHSPYKKPGDAPKQGILSKEMFQIEIDPSMTDAMKGMEEGARYVVMYLADKADRTKLQTIPPWADKLYGVFASRSPHRPNPINLCVVRVKKIEGNILTVTGLDALDNSPLVDIKPYVPELGDPK